MSLFLAKVAGDSGLVIAFEPVWPMYCRLCNAVQFDMTLKASIVAVPCGLADSEKRTTINVPGGDFGMGSIADASAWAGVQNGKPLRSYSIQLVTLDSFLTSTGTRPPDFIKIDVEGAELLVLRGATELFGSGHRPLMLIEVFAPWEHAFGYQPSVLFSWLLERGYLFLFACPNGLVDHLPTRESPFPPDYENGYNVVAYCPESHAERIDGLRHLRAGTGARLLPMAPPPQPNRLAELETVADPGRIQASVAT